MTRYSITRAMAALAAGLVLTMTGCAAEAPAPAGDDAYATARDRYTAMANELHAVIMAIEPAEWTVDQGQYGAMPVGCQVGASADTGFFFSAVRTVELSDRDPQQIADAADAAFADLGVEAEVGSFGEGVAREVNVVGESDAARTVVNIKPETGQVRVTSETVCEPGSTDEITTTMFGEELYPLDVWRRMPATEGPASVPQFFFPADGQVFYEEDGTPVDPQPVVTTAPTPPADE